MWVAAPTAIWRLPLIWLKPMPKAFSICSSSRRSIRPAVAAPATNPRSWVANQPSVIVQSGTSIARASRVMMSVPAQMAVINSRPLAPPSFSATANATGIVTMLGWPPSARSS
ncbi:hypothetical protein D3C83_30170 [compost metagenome]